MAAVARFLGSFLGSVFRSAWRVCRVLWVCRVAAVSALGGGALMALIPQSVDLFADTGLPAWRWGWFFFSLFVWAWLVHAMASCAAVRRVGAGSPSTGRLERRGPHPIARS